jgi:hypothetical protein
MRIWSALILLILFSSSVHAGWIHTGTRNNLDCLTGGDVVGSLPWRQGAPDGNGWFICEQFIEEFEGDDPCGESEVWNQEIQDCDAPPFDCPVGTVLVGDFCLPEAPEEDDCQNISGYINGQAVCDDKKDECEAAGGQYGQFNGQDACVPPEEDTGCESGSTTTIIDNGDGTFGYVCNSDDDITDNENGTDDEKNNNNDLGGDEDRDIPPPNPEDTTDPDPQDLTDDTELQREQLGESQEQSKELRNQTNQLDDINNELNVQTDELRTIGEKSTNISDKIDLMVTPNALPAHTSNNAQSSAEAFSNFATRISNAPLLLAGSNVSGIFSSSGASCSPLVIDLSSTPIGILSTNIFCELLDDLAPYLSAVMLAVFSFLGFKTVMRS